MRARIAPAVGVTPFDFNLGHAVTVVASATATRALQAANGKVLGAQKVHDGAIASTRDWYAAIADTVADLKR